MNIDKNTKLRDLMKKYPWLIDEAVKLDPQFKQLKSPVAKVWLKTATVSDLSKKAGVSADEVINTIKTIIAKHK